MALTSLEEAQEWVVSRCEPLKPEQLRLREALGCVLAEDVVSAETVPPFANTAMDGFAVRAADVGVVPTTLQVIATLAAGATPADEHRVGRGEAVRIMTGAAMPSGADTIVPIEHVDRSAAGASTVTILQTAKVGDAVRPAGEDITLGQLVFASGAVLNAGHIGMLASIGRESVTAQRRVRVGVLSTGDELVAPPQPLAIGQIRDSNRYTLLALVELAGCEAIDLGLARDNESEIESVVRRGIAECDAIVTSGGVSVGDFDFVKVVLDRLATAGGAPMRWMQVAIKPAKPLAFGVIGGRPVFGLPGNPVSCMVSFELFARPGLRRMMGHSEMSLHRPPVRAIADEGLRREPDGKTHFTRVIASFGPDGRVHVRSTGSQGSNLLSSMALADALAVLPDGPAIGQGGEVDVLLLDRRM